MHICMYVYFNIASFLFSWVPQRSLTLGETAWFVYSETWLIYEVT